MAPICQWMEPIMPAIPFSSTLRSRPAEILTALGLLSGFLSAGWGQTYELEALQPLAIVFLLAPAALPIGFFYGAALGIGMAAWARKPWVAIIVIVTTMYAWSAAIHTAVRLQRNSGEDAYLVAASLCAGAIGAGLTHLGCAIVSAELRRPWRIGLTCVVGAVAGMLFFLGERKILDERLLYVIWQPAVAFCIGLGLPRPSKDA
jgi:fumarate reductase subunit D